MRQKLVVAHFNALFRLLLLSRDGARFRGSSSGRVSGLGIPGVAMHPTDSDAGWYSLNFFIGRRHGGSVVIGDYASILSVGILISRLLHLIGVTVELHALQLHCGNKLCPIMQLPFEGSVLVQA